MSQISFADAEYAGKMCIRDRFPKGELWSWTMYLSSYKFSFLSDLPKVDPNTGQLIES